MLRINKWNCCLSCLLVKTDSYNGVVLYLETVNSCNSDLSGDIAPINKGAHHLAHNRLHI